MSNENQNKKYDGQNRCRRCDRPLSDPNDIYGWRCAQIVGANKYNEIASMLDEDSLNVYNAYVSTYLVDDNKTITDNSGKLEKVAWMDSVKEGAEWIGNKLYDAWNWGEDNIWKGIAAGMKAVGYELTADLLSLSASGSGNIYEKTSGSYASNLLKNDKGISQKVNDIIWERGTSQGKRYISTEPIWYKIPLGNGDLGAALHNVNIQVDAIQQNNGVWYANVTVTDKFDFTEFVNPLSQDSVVKGILWAANDIAYFDTKWGLLDSVDVKIKFSNFY
jgi:hypothetical protein